MKNIKNFQQFESVDMDGEPKDLKIGDYVDLFGFRSAKVVGFANSYQEIKDNFKYGSLTERCDKNYKGLWIALYREFDDITYFTNEKDIHHIAGRGLSWIRK